MASKKSNGKRPLRQNGHSQFDEDDGQAMTSFDLSEEKEEGKFDDNGHFVWSNEDKAVQEDSWLEGIDAKQMDAAKSAKSRRDVQNEVESEQMTEENANKTLESLLKPRETVLQALKRLGTKKRSKAGNKRRRTSESATEQTAEEKQQFNQVTEAADFLIRRGNGDVYSQIREEFIPEDDLVQRQEDQEGHVRFSEPEETKQSQGPETMWEYRGTDGQIHGPYPTSTIVAWQQHGYFKGSGAVPMRQKKATESEEKVSAEQELLNDFDDSDEEKEDTWEQSDQIDFKSY